MTSMTEDLLRDLIAAGTDPALVARVARLVARVEADDERRAKNAERMRNVRARARTCSNVQHVSAHRQNIEENQWADEDVRARAHTVEHIYKKKEDIPSEKKEERKEEEKKERKKVMRGSRLSDDWKPSEFECAFAKSQGMTEADIAGQAGRFRDYWCSKPGAGGVKLDWPATWRNWCRTFCEKAGRAPVEAVSTGPPTPIGWKPGMPTHEELLARHAKNLRPNGADHGEELRPTGDGIHRGDVGGRPQKPPDDSAGFG